ncbi:hypothetical protein NKI56_25295 [Mesorhizobium sp. M0622]|uniref:hypothetical protein n=1 Tax=unclassified Mesorhizobium TaxID=325217 RepID=UPI003335464E
MAAASDPPSWEVEQRLWDEASKRVSDEVKQTAGTELTESAIGLDRQSRIDLHLRIEALGNELGRIDGNIGPQTRRAIGISGKPRMVLRRPPI